MLTATEIKKLATPSWYNLTDYVTGTSHSTFLYDIAEFDMQNQIPPARYPIYTSVIREVQLALDITGNIDSPL